MFDSYLSVNREWVVKRVLIVSFGGCAFDDCHPTLPTRINILTHRLTVFEAQAYCISLTEAQANCISLTVSCNACVITECYNSDVDKYSVNRHDTYEVTLKS